jgi:hypothetical protein
VCGVVGVEYWNDAMLVVVWFGGVNEMRGIRAFTEQRGGVRKSRRFLPYLTISFVLIKYYKVYLHRR